MKSDGIYLTGSEWLPDLGIGETCEIFHSSGNVYILENLGVGLFFYICVGRKNSSTLGLLLGSNQDLNNV